MASDPISGIVFFLFLLLIGFFSFKYLGGQKAMDEFARSKQRQQTGDKDKKMRVCLNPPFPPPVTISSEC